MLGVEVADEGEDEDGFGAEVVDGLVDGSAIVETGS